MCSVATACRDRALGHACPARQIAPESHPGGVSTRKTVLIVDDHPTGLELAETAIRALGPTLVVATATSGEETLRKARAIGPDLILLDIRLPAVDGFSVVRELRRDPLTANVRIVALTASGMSGDREKALGGGFDGYITKPISITELRKEVVAWLSGTKSARIRG